MIKNNTLLPYSSSFPPIGQSFIVLASVDSTNNYAMAQAKLGLAGHGTLYFAQEQTAGKGQRGKPWKTGKAENIALSIVLEPAGLSLANPFPLSAAVALACYDLFKKYVDAKFLAIKWPNDLYWQDRKAGGILIETVSRGQSWEFAIVGIGLNVNAPSFGADLPNAVSLYQVTAKKYDLPGLAKELANCLQTRFECLLQGEPMALVNEYNRVLYKRGQMQKLRKGNLVFETGIVGVSENGMLLTKDSDGKETQFHSGEIEWLIE